MPEMDGIELGPPCAELDPELKIMFITGFAAVALNSDDKTTKEAKVLSKPFHLKRSGRTEVERMLNAKDKSCTIKLLTHNLVFKHCLLTSIRKLFYRIKSQQWGR